MSGAVFAGAAAFVLTLVAIEFLFRRWYRRKHGADYFVALKFPWHENHVVAHPFLTFAYRKRGAIQINQRLPYVLDPKRYWSFKVPLQLNAIGHFGRDLTIEKSAGVLRVACLGSSGVANNIADETRDYCWPVMLEEKLSASCSGGAEVMNCGIGGWTMVDVFVDFSLNVIPFNPDMVILYQGLNDLPLHLMKDYSFDYAHGRRNLGEVLHAVKRGYWFPKLSWWHSYEYARDRLVGTGNIRNEVLARIETQAPDYARPFRPLIVEEMATRHILDLCRARNIKVVVATYAFYDHNGTPRNRKLKEGVDLENQMFRRLAAEYGHPVIDIAAAVPQDAKHFVDAVHFSPQGMEVVAAKMAEHLVDQMAHGSRI